MYKNIIFDIGNVLLDFSPLVHLRCDFEDGLVQDLYEFIFKSEEWLMLDRGTLTEAQAIAILSEQHKSYGIHIEQVFEKWHDMLQPIAENVALLTALKEKGYKLYYLSNFQDAAFKQMNQRYDFFELFDGGIASFEVKLLKPEQEIYRALLNAYDLEPQDCLFVDDTQENIACAMQLGIDGIWLHSREKLYDELVQRGVLDQLE